MEYLELGDVIAIASRVFELEGDAVLRVVNLGLVDSAIARPRSGFGDEEFYPTLPMKAAALLHGLTRNHAFLDGNKRTAVLSTLQFLNLNGCDLDLEPPDAAYKTIAAVAAGDMTLPELTEWITARLRDLEH